jgi:enoyl-CoA hydratase
MPVNLLIDERSGYIVITINRAAAFNTLSIDTLKELADGFRLISDRDDIAAVILTGTGESFAAGADIKELSALTPQSAIEFSKRGQDLFTLMEHLPQLVIAAIDGYCLGGGLDLALACDIRYGSSRSTFAHPGAKLGIITGFGGTMRLPETVGIASAVRMITTAERIDALAAERIGLVQQVVDGDVMAVAISLAERAVARGRKTISYFKEIIRQTSRVTSNQSDLIERRSKDLFNRS